MMGWIVVAFVQSLSCARLFATPWTAAHQAPLSFTNSWSLLQFMSIEILMPPTISPSAVPFSSCLQSFSTSGFFPIIWLFTTGGQSIGNSALVLPMIIQDWFPLGLISLISLQSEGLESSPAPQFKSISSSAFSLLYGQTLGTIHDYWKNTSFD